MNKIEIKKELYKSKVNAKFSHYTSGNIYYTVELENGIYQFPIGTVQIGTVVEIVGPCRTKDLDNEGFLDVDGLYTNEEIKKYYERKKSSEERDGILVGDKPLEVQVSKLSDDLGTTTFHAEMRGSELNRWIDKAIDSNDFIKIN